MIRLKTLTANDLPELLAIRNDPTTRQMLHDTREFGLTECEEWFRRTQPHWFRVDGPEEQMVAYIRTSSADYRARRLFVGCDVHPKFRRQGYARRAYQHFLPELWKRGWREARLLVKKNNSPAIALYNALNFVPVVDRGESVEMMLPSPICHTGRNVKVIATYFGDRRGHPQNASDAYFLLGYIWKQETSVDQGEPFDTVFVNNRVIRPTGRYPADAVSDPIAVTECEQLLQSFHLRNTKHGAAIVLERDNIGLSFGAFDFAFRSMMHLYDYWFFLEDDQVVVQEGVFHQCVKQLMSYDNLAARQNGFVATVGVNREIGPAAHGGCGVTSRWILEEVVNGNISENSCGQLPFWNTSKRGADGHEMAGEVPFTQCIHDLGYQLDECLYEDLCVSWGQHKKRTPKTKPFLDSLRLEARAFLLEHVRH